MRSYPLRPVLSSAKSPSLVPFYSIRCHLWPSIVCSAAAFEPARQPPQPLGGGACRARLLLVSIEVDHNIHIYNYCRSQLSIHNNHQRESHGVQM